MELQPCQYVESGWRLNVPFFRGSPQSDILARENRLRQTKTSFPLEKKSLIFVYCCIDGNLQNDEGSWFLKVHAR
jgi:hypothetical protein